MKTRYYLLSIISALLVGMTSLFVACDKDLDDIVKYTGKVVYINTTNPFPDLEVRLTDGSNVYCVEHTDTDGGFTLTVKVAEISGDYYILVGDSTCIPKKVELPGYGQPEINLGTIEVEGPAAPTVKTAQVTNVTANSATTGGVVITDGRMKVTARGVCYAKAQYPTIRDAHTVDGVGIGEFTSNVGGLDYNTIYYVRAYATNAIGTAYGEQLMFNTEEGVAIVVTDSVYNVTVHTAKCKGHVVSDGGFPVTKRGTCWSKRPDPTIDDNITEEGTGLGEFTSTLNNLVENTIYYVRTYATNSTKTVYGEQIIITTQDGLARVTSDSVRSVTANSAICYGTVTFDCDILVTARGFCYATSPSPTIDNTTTIAGSGLGQFQSTLTQLEPETTYYVRAYATNATATIYGEQLTITTLDGLAVVKSDSIGSITANSAICYGTVASDCGIPVTVRGFCYATTQDPTIENACVTVGKGLGQFKTTLSNLSYGATYYVRAFATNATETTYGKQLTITTKNGLPAVTTGAVSNVGAVSATCSGNVTDDGTLSVLARGICYGTDQQPTIDGLHTTDGKGMGEYTTILKNLKDKTTYYVRAYATTDAGTSYGEQRSFQTTDGLPVVEMTMLKDTTASSVTCIANVMNDGGIPVTARGFCYSTAQYPTTASQYITIGEGKGAFTGSITGLTVGTTYYIRAYATNSVGTAYSQQVSFTTLRGLPVVTTTQTTSSASEITVGGNVISNGGFPVSERGVCYSTTNAQPTLSDSYEVGGSGNGTYTVSVKGLKANTNYYVRAYATNINGTVYGEALTIKTQNGAANLTTSSISNITALSATGGVSVSDAGGSVLKTCGICWATTPNPTVANDMVEGGTQLGNYTCQMTNLQPNTVYYVRAYATTDVQTTYGNQVTFTTSSGLPTLTTTTATSTATTIVTGGNISEDGGYSVTDRGICYSSTNAQPTTADMSVSNGAGKGAYTSTIANLQVSTTYYVRAYATNSIGTAYGEVVTIKTKDGVANPTTSSVTNIMALSATGGVSVTDAGGSVLKTCGICWATTPNLTVANDMVEGGTQLGNYTCQMTNLQPNTVYYVRAYATTEIQTTYGNQVTFTTASGLPVLITATATSTSTTIVTGGNISEDGGYSVTDRGICYSSTNAQPTTADMSVSNGAGKGIYSSTIANLQVSTTYYVRAYATNSIGTAYGEVVTIITKDGLPTVTTTDPKDNVTATTIITGGQVTDDGGFTITERGVVYSILPHPTIDNATKVTCGVGSGFFTAVINGVDTDSKGYYIRAYAINVNGVGYGDEILVDKGKIIEYAELDVFTFQGVTYKLSKDLGEMEWSNAKSACENLVLYGFSDWFLPSDEELKVAMEQNKVIVNNQALNGWLRQDECSYSCSYWSSLANNSNALSIYLHDNGGILSSSTYKRNKCRVRAVRKVQ